MRIPPRPSTRPKGSIIVRQVRPLRNAAPTKGLGVLHRSEAVADHKVRVVIGVSGTGPLQELAREETREPGARLDVIVDAIEHREIRFLPDPSPSRSVRPSRHR